MTTQRSLANAPTSAAAPTPEQAAAPRVAAVGNQARLRRLQAAVGPHAGALAALPVSRPWDAEERSARSAADGPPRAAPPVLRISGDTPSPLAAALGEGRASEEAGVGEMRVHTGERAGAIAQAFDARAVTIGRDVAFAPGAYAPGTIEGRRLIAHEAAHVAASHGAATRVFRDEAKETAADVDQRVLKGMTDIVGKKLDDEAQLTAIVDLLASVPQEQILHLYGRLEPGAPTDDFAQYFKTGFPKNRTPALASLRNRYSGKFPGDSAAPTEIADNTVVAAKSLAQLNLHFSGSMSGEGWRMNPKFWTVKYILTRGDKRQEFVGADSKPSALAQVNDFLENHTEWRGDQTVITIEISFGKFGGSAALNDMWNPGSSDLYAFDCLNAAWMVQLRGQYLSYPSKTRDVDFDRDFKSYVTRFTPEDAKRSDPADYEEIKLPQPLKLAQTAELAKALKPGDEATISNPFMPESSPFRNENVVYIGDLQFYGHPFKLFTLDSYIGKLIGYLDPKKSEAERTELIRNTCFIRDISRPKNR